MPDDDIAEQGYPEAVDNGGNIMDPFTPQEETFLKTVSSLKRFITVRKYRDASHVLTDSEFHTALLDPLNLQFGRAATATPNGQRLLFAR